jgi:dihydroneopterin aldolase
MDDYIYISGIRSYGYTGALLEEQVLGQWFEVDVTLWLDLSHPGKTDRLEDTLDYRAVIAQVQHLIKCSKFALLERLAAAIAESLLEFQLIEQVQVKLTKLAAPIPDFAGKVTIELTRQQTNDF